MEKNLKNELDELIQKITEEKTFSLEALKSISDLSEKVNFLEEENFNLKAKQGELFKINDKLNEECKILKVKLGAYSLRENDIKEIETERRVNQIKMQMFEKNNNDIKEIVSLVFKNPIIKKTTSGDYPTGEYSKTHCYREETEEIQ